MALRYEALTWTGRRVKGVLETDSEDAAYDLLREAALVPCRVTRTRRLGSLPPIARRLFQPTAQDLIEFTQQTASLLNSGIPLRRALAAQQAQTRSPSLRNAIGQIISDIDDGGRLSDAFGRQRATFPDFYLRLLKIGEATGNLSFALERLADNMKTRKGVRDRVKKALTYPAISMAVAVVAALVLVRYSLPALVDLLREFGGELPLITRLLISVTEYVQAYVVFALPVVAVLVVVSATLIRAPAARKVVDQVLLKMPFIGSILISSNMFFLTSTLSTLLRAGLPPIEALRLTQHSLSNVVLRDSLETVTREASEGIRLGEAVSRQAVFPPLLSQAIATGEMRGSQTDTLQGLADYYQHQTDRALSSATEMIQPAVTLAVAGVVGFVAVAVISGIYSTLSSIR